jgi:hypothetical protein
MTFDEYVRGAGPVRTHSGDPQAAAITGFGILSDPKTIYVWAVAVSGEVYPNGRVPVYFGGRPPASATPYPPYRWAILLVDATRGGLMVIGDAGVDQAWPAQFDALPSHPVTGVGAAPPVTASAPVAATSPAARSTSFASICGLISDFTSDSASTDGSFILNAPGRAPIRVTIPSGRLGGRASDYVCVQVQAGTPHPLFDGFFPSGTPGFVDAGTVPATVAFRHRLGS